MNKLIRSTFFLILLIFFSSPLMLQLSSCHPLKPFTDIETSDALKMLQPGKRSADLIILDVRTPEEYAGGYIAGAVNLDFKSPDFAAKLDALDKTKTYLVYCRSGGRSAKAMGIMKEKGFNRVYNLRGGIMEWKTQNQPLNGN